MGHIDHLNNSPLCHSIFTLCKYEHYQNYLNLDLRVNTAATKWFKDKYRNIEGGFCLILFSKTTMLQPVKLLCKYPGIM